jgi:putative peptidoglycan lipid II flippase
LGLALGLSYSLATLLSWHLLSRRLDGLQTYHTVRTLVRLSVAATIAFVPATLVAHGISRWLGWGHLAVFGALLVGLAIGALIFIPLSARLRVPEVGAVLEPLLRRLPLRHRPAGSGAGAR